MGLSGAIMTTDEALYFLRSDPETFREALKQFDAEAEARAESDADRLTAKLERQRARLRDAVQGA